MDEGEERFEAWSEARARELIAPLRDEPGALLPILHRLQEVFGCVDPRAVPIVADEIDWSQAEVYGVVSFYRDFRSAPPGRNVVRLCRAEACQALGAADLVALAEERTGLRLGETSSDRSLTLEAVYCLGNCALGPSVQVNGALVGRIDADWVDSLAAGPAAPGGPRAPGLTHNFARSRRTASASVVPPSATATVVYVPGDAAVRGVGGDEVATALLAEAERRGVSLRIVRNGSRGVLWLEPLVEVATAGGRMAYGPVGPGDVHGLFEAGFPDASTHALALGLTEEIEWLARQTRRTFARVGVVDPLSIEDYERAGGSPGCGVRSGWSRRRSWKRSPPRD